MFFLSVLTNYVLPIIYDSFVVLVLVLLFLFIFRIKDSNVRILFFFLPLIKPFVITMERVDASKLYNIFRIGIRFPDPANILKIDNSSNVIISDPNYFALIITVSIIFLFLLLRWISIALFYRRLAYEDKVDKEDVPDVYKIIDKFVQKIKTDSPDVSLTHRNYYSPFVIGVKKFILLLSPKLLDNLSYAEKNVLIQHELSHIKRRDNLIGWISLILRDLNFFNPFAYIAYYLIRGEQEKACDKLVVKHSDKSSTEIAKNILNSILKLKLLAVSGSRSGPLEGSAFSPVGIFSQRRLENRISSIIKTNPDKIFIRIFPKILMYFLFIFILFIQIVVVVKWSDFIFLLR